MTKPSAKQGGAVLIIFLTMLILGGAWFVTGALSKASPGNPEREVISGDALKLAKQALLAHVALTAASGTEFNPGRLPCPEDPSRAGGLYEGRASDPLDTAIPPMNCVAVGRLPWKTLGVDQIRDGFGETLWYGVSIGTWARSDSSTPLIINPAKTNQLVLDGTANAVAVIIAPGRPLNTTSELGNPAASQCTTVNQQVGSRLTVPLNPSSFLECGNATGNHRAIAPSPWSNDRTITITASEVMAAIAGPVADRLQRQVAPAFEDWRLTESNANWGRGQFLPWASTFDTTPAANSLCGDDDRREGFTPLTRSATSSCTSWTGGNVAQVLGVLNSPTCAPVANTHLECNFFNASVLPPLTVRITATADRVGGAFRRPLTAGMIINNRGGAIVAGPSYSLNTGNGGVSIQFDMQFPFLAIGATRIIIPNLPDGAVLSDPRVAWFADNDWGRFTYYNISPGARLGDTNECVAPPANCVTVNGLPLSNASNNKHFVIALMGPALPGQVQTNNRDDYLESRLTASEFNSRPVKWDFNDRLATCPFRHTAGSFLC